MQSYGSYNWPHLINGMGFDSISEREIFGPRQISFVAHYVNQYSSIDSHMKHDY